MTNPLLIIQFMVIHGGVNIHKPQDGVEKIIVGGLPEKNASRKTCPSTGMSKTFNLILRVIFTARIGRPSMR